MLPEGGGWLLVEFGGNDRDEADGRAHELMQALEKSSCKPNMKLLRDPDQQRKIWEVREAGLGATAHVPGQPDTWGGRSEEHTSELPSLMRSSYAVFCLKTKHKHQYHIR